MEDTTASSVLQDKRRDYFGKFRYVFKLIGLSLENNETSAYKIYSFVLIFSTAFLYPFLRVLELTVLKNIPVDYERFLYPYLTAGIFAKTMVFLRKRTKLAKLLDKLEREPFLPTQSRGNNVEEENLQKNCMQIIKNQSIIYVSSTIIIITLLATEPLVRRILSSDYHDWVFQYGQIYLVNVTHSPTYELGWLYENFSIYILGIHFAIVDAIAAAILTYICFQFKMLQNNIRRIVEMNYNEMLKEPGKSENSNETSLVDASMVPWKYLKNSLTQTINYHLAILNEAGETEEVFSGLLLFLFLNTLGLLGVLVGQASLIARVGPFVAGGQIFLTCFWGEQLMHESQEVGRAAFEANFVGADLRFQKFLALIIRRSQNPVALTAGKFTVVGLSPFIWILRAGYSASTVLRQVK